MPKLHTAKRVAAFATQAKADPALTARYREAQTRLLEAVMALQYVTGAALAADYLEAIAGSLRDAARHPHRLQSGGGAGRPKGASIADPHIDGLVRAMWRAQARGDKGATLSALARSLATRWCFIDEASRRRRLQRLLKAEVEQMAAAMEGEPQELAPTDNALRPPKPM